MEDSCRVSVILTTFNSEHCIRQTLDSILAQAMVDFELIILDDGSSDNTVNILKTYPDPRIRLIFNEQNMGVSATRNRGMATARGKYICPSDHDDVWTPDKLQVQVDYLEAHPAVTLLTSQVEFFLRGEEYPHHQYDSPAPHILHWMLYLRSPIVHSSICFRRSLWQQYNLQYNGEIKYADDYELYYLFADIGPIHMLDQKLVIKYEDGENASFSRKTEMDQSLRRLYIERYQHLFDGPVSEQEIQRIQNICNEGQVAKDPIELIQLGEFIELFTKKISERYALSNSHTAELRLAASDEWWRAIAHYAKANRKPSALLIYKKIPFFKFCPRAMKSWVRETIAATLGTVWLERVRRIST